MNNLSSRGDLEERASQLVTLAYGLAISSSSIRNNETCLRSLDDEWWDLVITTAGVFIAATRLRNLGVPSALEESLMRVVAEKFHQWNPNDALRAFDDCKAFFNRTYPGLEEAAEGSDRRFVSSDAVGAWIMWTLLEHPPEAEDERRLVRALGMLVTHAFFDYWAAE